MDNKTKPALNMRYYNKEIDDDPPYVGHLDYDEETGFIYDEEGDVVDEDTIAKFVRVMVRATMRMNLNPLFLSGGAKMANDKTIWEFLKSQGLNDYGVAGLMGNLYAESGLLQQIFRTHITISSA